VAFTSFDSAPIRRSACAPPALRVNFCAMEIERKIAEAAVGNDGHADYLVERRGFEPPTSAVQPSARLTGSSLRFLSGSSATSPHSWSRL
jgi:hypothetical protein